MSHSLRAKGRAVAALVALVPALATQGNAQADPPPGLDAKIRCKVEGAAAVCHVSAEPSILSHISYARADVLQAPAFLNVVVGGVQYRNAIDREQRLNLAFSAKRSGEGDITVKVQAIVCADNGTSCPALARMVVAHLKIGP